MVDGGGKQVVVRCPAHAAARAPQHHLPKVNVEDFSEGDLPAEGLPGAPRVLTIACSDILHLLDDAASLSATTLRHAFVQPLDSSSEAGDHPPSAHDPQQHQHQQEAQHGGQHEKAPAQPVPSTSPPARSCCFVASLCCPWHILV